MRIWRYYRKNPNFLGILLVFYIKIAEIAFDLLSIYGTVVLGYIDSVVVKLLLSSIIWGYFCADGADEREKLWPKRQL